MPAHSKIKPLRSSRDAVTAWRVCQLINEYHDGNVSAAARDIGVSRERLRNLALGITAKPSYDLLGQISAHYNATVDWIVGRFGAER